MSNVNRLFTPFNQRLVEIENGIGGNYALEEYKMEFIEIEGKIEEFTFNESIPIIRHYKSRVEKTLTTCDKSCFDELQFYKMRLQYMFDTRMSPTESGIDMNQALTLSNDFELKQITFNFHPKINTAVGALFLKYLQQLKYMPMFDNKSTGKIAMILFAKSGTKVTQVKNEKKEQTTKKHLNELLLLLKEIEDKVQEDLRQKY